jgi:NADP-dependent 3-hydroxy acid dehydrogenase YdfG
MVRASLVEPGATESEMQTALASNPGVPAVPVAGFQWLAAQDVADAVRYVVTRPAHVSINELLVRPTGQSFAPSADATRSTSTELST